MPERRNESSVGDTIRRVLQQLGLVRYGRFERPAAQEGLALDKLLAEKDRYREALRAMDTHAKRLHIDQGRSLQAHIEEALRDA